MPIPTYLSEVTFTIPVTGEVFVIQARHLYQIRGVREVVLTQTSTVKVRFAVKPGDDLFTIQNSICRFLERSM